MNADRYVDYIDGNGLVSLMDGLNPLELRAAAAGIVRQPQGGCRRPPRIAFRNMVFTV